MHKAFKFRLYPNKEQRVMIAKSIGCNRFVYNTFLAKRKEAWEESINYNTCSAMLTQLKKEIPWLKEPDSFSMQSSLKDLDFAYQNFFKEKPGYPKFKSKRNPVQSYTSKCNNSSIRVNANLIKLPKLGFVKFAKSREVNGQIISATIRHNPSGKYFISVLADIIIELLPEVGQFVGIDLGIKDFEILSNGEKIHNPKYYRKIEAKLARLQRSLSRKQKGSNNRNKARIILANYYEKIANCRRDFLQQLSTRIIRENQIICLEDLPLVAVKPLTSAMGI